MWCVAVRLVYLTMLPNDHILSYKRSRSCASHEGVREKWMHWSTHLLTSALDGDLWSASCTGRVFPPKKITPPSRYPLISRLGGRQEKSDRFKGQKNPLPLQEADHTFSPSTAVSTKRLPSATCWLTFPRTDATRRVPQSQIFKSRQTVQVLTPITIQHYPCHFYLVALLLKLILKPLNTCHSILPVQHPHTWWLLTGPESERKRSLFC